MKTKEGGKLSADFAESADGALRVLRGNTLWINAGCALSKRASSGPIRLDPATSSPCKAFFSQVKNLRQSADYNRISTTQSLSAWVGGFPMATVPGPFTFLTVPVCNRPPFLGLNHFTVKVSVARPRSSFVVPPNFR